MKLTETGELTMKMAKVGYESYAAHTGNKSAVTGGDLPTWEKLPGAVKNAWFASAAGMTNFLASVEHIEIVDKYMVPEKHTYSSDKKYPWFCAKCGYPEYEKNKHL